MKKTYDKAYKIFFVIIIFINVVIVDKAISGKYQIEEKMSDLLSSYPTEIFNKLRENPEPELINEVLSSLTTSPNSAVRSNCAIVLQAQKNNLKVIQGLIIALETVKDPIVKVTISRVLGKTNSPEAVKALEKFILTNNDIIGHHGYLARAEAIQSLGKCGPTATESLVTISKNTAIWKTNAGDLVVALGLTGDERAIPKIIEVMKDSDYNIRSAAAYALTIKIFNYSPQTKDSIFNALVEKVDDESYLVRQQVAESFGKLGDTRASPYLEKMKNDQYKAVYQITENGVGREEKQYPVRAAAQQALEKLK